MKVTVCQPVQSHPEYGHHEGDDFFLIDGRDNDNDDDDDDDEVIIVINPIQCGGGLREPPLS